MRKVHRNLTGLLDLTSDQLATLLTQAEACLQAEESSRARLLPYSGKNAIFMRWSHLQKSQGTSQMSPFEIRTSDYFSSACQRVGIDCLLLSPHDCEASSAEALDDMLAFLDASLKLVSNAPQTLSDRLDLLFMRHPASDAPESIANASAVIKRNICIVNSGGSTNENPVDALTLLHLIRIRGKHQDLSGLRVAVAGDIGFEAIGHSLIAGLLRLGAIVTLVAPPDIATHAFLDSHPELNVSRAVTLEDAHTDLPDVVVSLPVREELLRTGIIKNRDSFLSSLQLVRYAVRHAKDVLFIGYDDARKHDAFDLLCDAPGADLARINRIVNCPTALDEAATRMAVINYCLGL